MRDFKSMKRQRSRNRGGGGGGSSGGGGGGKPQHNANRAFDSNGPDGVKIRGNAQHVFEKYQQLARDAGAAGDRVLAEGYLQHAEHYFRVLRAVQPQRPASEIIGRDAFTSGIDIDFEDDTIVEQTEGEAQAEATGEEGGENRSEPRGENGRQEYRDRGGYNRDDRRPDYRRDEYRQDRPEARRDDRPPEARRDDRSEPRRDDRPEGRTEARSDGRQDRSRYEGGRDDRSGYNRDDRQGQGQGQGQAQGQGRDRDRDRDRNFNRDDRPARFESRDRFEGRPREVAATDPLPVVEPEATPLTGRSGGEDTGAHTLRSQDGGFSPAPAFLQARPESPAAEEAEAAPEPRRRRTRTPKPAAEAPAEES